VRKDTNNAALESRDDQTSHSPNNDVQQEEGCQFTSGTTEEAGGARTNFSHGIVVVLKVKS
jgi:hypothetical protein